MFEERESELLEFLGELVKTDDGQGVLCELSEIISRKNKKIKELEKKISDYRWELFPDRMGR